jgi:hypothetical protein
VFFEGIDRLNGSIKNNRKKGKEKKRKKRFKLNDLNKKGKKKVIFIYVEECSEENGTEKKKSLFFVTKIVTFYSCFQGKDMIVICSKK